MDIADLRYHAWAVAAALLVGCATAPSANPAPPLLPVAGSAAHTLASYVFVSECCGHGSITLYNLGLTGVAEQITKGGAYPGVITVDRSGRLYDIIDQIYDGSVTEYDRGSDTPSRHIEKDYARAVAADSANNLYVASCPSCIEYHSHSGDGSVDVYKAGTTKLVRTITKGIDQPISLAVDTNDDLYVLNPSYPHPTVTVYAPGSGKPLRKLTQGLSGVAVVALDPSNNVFVMNGSGYGNQSIVEYQAASDKLLRTITSGIQSPKAIALDGSGTLYVANDSGGVGRGMISVYPPGASTPSYQIESGVDYPSALTVDDKDELYVANVGYSSPIHDRHAVCVYAPNTKKPLRCVRGRRKYDLPTSLATGR
jgi:DNA-binding beta-propeller fold protein YncE